MSGSFKNRFAQKVDAETEFVLSLDFYQHKTIKQAIEAPFKALEQGGGVNFENSLSSVKLASYMLEKLAWAAGTLKESDEGLKKFVESEKIKLLEEGNKIDDENFKARLAYAKIAYILKMIQTKRPSSTEMQV